MIAVRIRKPHRRKALKVRTRKHFAVLIEGVRVRRLLQVNYQAHGVFYLIELQAHKTVTNLRRYHRSGSVCRFAPNNMIMGGLIA